jgi:hypothetical protein
MFDDVLSATACGLGHLVVLAAFGVVELRVLAVVVGQETAAETQGFELYDGGEREGMKPPETAVFVEELGHGRGLD